MEVNDWIELAKSVLKDPDATPHDKRMAVKYLNEAQYLIEEKEKE